MKLYIPNRWWEGPAHSPLPTPHSPGSGETQEGQHPTLVSLFFSINTPSLMLVTTMIPLSK